MPLQPLLISATAAGDALDQEVIRFVGRTNFESDNNTLGKSLVRDSSGLSWVGNSNRASNYVAISSSAINSITNTFISSDRTNRRVRGPKQKRDGKTQINLEIKPEGTTWDNYDRKSDDFLDDFTGYCNYHINIL